MSNLEKVKAEIYDYDYIRFAVCDLNGVSRGQVIPSRNAAKYLKSGVDCFEGLLLLGSETEYVPCPHEKSYRLGNMSIFPDLDTLRPIPWGGEEDIKIGEMLCESRWKTDQSPQEACPRYVARQQLKRLDELGLRLYSAFEVEYVLFHADTMKPVSDGDLYMDHRNHNKHKQTLFDFDQLLLKSGIDIERFHSEGYPGMFEAVMKPTYGIECPDSAFNLKQGLQEIADQKGFKALFVSLLEENEVGPSSHFNFSLINKENGENVFCDVKDPDKISFTAKQWIAGILKHSKALAALTLPTPICYKRLKSPVDPDSIFWGIENREALLRVKNHGSSGTYFENKLPSGKSNPYLVVASTIAAGLDGVINKLECPPQGRMKESEHVPKTLEDALEALKEDAALVNALGEELVSWFVKCKDIDVQKYNSLTEEESFALAKKIYQ